MIDRASRRRVFRLGVGAKHVERDVDQELAFHVEMRTRKLIAAGVEPDLARAKAIEQFGDLRAVRAECVDIDYEKERAVRRTNYLSDLRQDIVYALRAMRQNAGFTAVVLLTLALGIGANTSTFTLIDALLLRALPVPHPERLVTVGNPARTGGLSEGSVRNDIASYPLFADVRDQTHTLSSMYATGRTDRLDVTVDKGQSESEHPHGRFVSANFFSVLQLPAVAGRTFTPDEDRVPAGAPVVVISYAYWQNRFGGVRSTVGRTISVNGVPLTIVGVAPSSFTGEIVGQRTDLWIPIMEQPALMPNSPMLNDRGISWLLFMGRLAPGVSLAQARAEITSIENRSILDHVTASRRVDAESSIRESPLRVESGARGFSYYRRVFAAPLYILMAAVGVVLLIVCANLANLMLARAASRGREMSVRMALGASRLRLVQQLLTESVILALAGGTLGVLLAIWGSSALMALTGGVALDARMDGRVLAFTALLALATAVIFGLVPALRATRVELATALRAQGRGVSSGERGTGKFGLGKMLVVAQVALSVLLLVGTGMLVRSMQRLQGTDIGVARDQLLLVHVDAQRAGYRDVRLSALMRDLMDRATRVQGVESATLSENGIFSGTESGTNLQVEGFTAHADADTNIAYDDVGPGYFHTTGAHLLQGRDFDARDNESGQKVAVLNETAAKFFFPRGGALGAHVSADSATADPSLVLQAESLPDLIQESIAQDRLLARVVSVFGMLALALAALGLYGVMTYATTRRTSEFGLRMALGAEPGDVTKLVLVEAMLLVAGGVIVGMPAALGAMRLLRSQLYDVALLDAPSIVTALVVLGASAALAGYLPARRAARVGPLTALRES